MCSDSCSDLVDSLRRALQPRERDYITLVLPALDDKSMDKASTILECLIPHGSA